ncbi:hypothetical protein CR513_18293, partial [Mucuna pruriens]
MRWMFIVSIILICLNPDKRWMLALKFYTLLRDADRSLWNGCHKHTKLSVVTQVLILKYKFNMRKRYEKINACLNYCMLYDKENNDPKVWSICLVCKHPRFKPNVRHSPKEKDAYMSKMCHDKSKITHPTDAIAWNNLTPAI